MSESRENESGERRELGARSARAVASDAAQIGSTVAHSGDFVSASRLALGAQQLAALRAQLAEQAISPRHARRIRVVLLSAEGLRGVEIARRLELSVGQVSRIRQRFLRQGVAGLSDAPHPGRHDHAVAPEAMARIAALVLSPPPEGCKRWSTRLIAVRVGLSSATVAKVLRNVSAAKRALP